MRVPLALMVLGGSIVYFIILGWADDHSSDAEPQTMTCAELADRDPGSNRHVRMTDYVLANRHVTLTNESYLWVMAIPRQRKSESDTTVVVRMNRLNLETLQAADVIRGMVISDSSWRSRDKEAIAQLTSGQVRLLIEGRRPMPLAGRIVFLTIGLAIIVWGFRRLPR